METVYFYIDETKFTKDTKEYLGLSLVLIRNENNVANIESQLKYLHHELSVDQYLDHNKDDRLFHFTEDSMEIKPKLIDRIRDFTIKAYIAYDIILKDDKFKNIYLKILHKLLYLRVSKNRHCTIHVFYEEQSQIKKPDIEKIREQILETIPIKEFCISKITKENILICLPDYILGIFRDITDATKKQYPHMQRNYAKLSSKIRLIIDMENNIFYSQKNPYQTFD